MEVEVLAMAWMLLGGNGGGRGGGGGVGASTQAETQNLLESFIFI